MKTIFIIAMGTFALASAAEFDLVKTFTTKTRCGPNDGMLKTQADCEAAAAKFGLPFQSVAGSEWHAGCLNHHGKVYYSALTAGGSHNQAVNDGYLCQNNKDATHMQTVWCGPTDGMINSEAECQAAAQANGQSYQSTAGSEWRAGCIIHNDGAYFVSLMDGAHNQAANGGYLCKDKVVTTTTSIASAAAKDNFNTNTAGGNWFADKANWSKGSFPVYPETARIENGKPVQLSPTGTNVPAPHAKMMDVRDMLTVTDVVLDLGPKDCVDGSEFEVSPPSRSADRVCQALKQCPYRHYETKEPTKFSDRQCEYDCLKNNCFVGTSGTNWFDNEATQWSLKAYPSYAGGTFVNKEVDLRKSTNGATDQLEIGANGLITIVANADADTLLHVGPSECDPLLEREIVAPTPTSDRTCQDLVVCRVEDKQFIAEEQTATEPRVCQDWQECDPKTEYEPSTSSPDLYNNRKCLSITPCPPGTEETMEPTATSDRECTPCPAGYAGAGDMAKCLPCGEKSGREYQPKSGQSLCEACAPCNDGEIRIDCSMDKGGKCAKCAGGSIKLDDFTCEACSKGTFEHLNMKCEECNAGRHSWDGATSCTSCKEGEYQPIDGAGTCKSCAASGKHYSHTKGEPLLLGGHSEAGHVGCSTHDTCDYALEFEDVAAGPTVNRVCKTARVCQPGEYETKELNHETRPGKNRECEECPRGFKCAGGAEAPEICPTGWYQNAEGQDHCEVCTNCAKGFVHSPDAQCGKDSPGTCVRCPAGFRKSVGSWNAVCTACAPGTFEVGDRTTCKICTSGRYSVSSSDVASPWGIPGPTECTSCTAGKFQANSKATECDSCSGYAHEDGDELANHGPAGHQKCSPHTECDEKTEFEVVAAGPTVNRECDKATTCRSGEYQTAPLLPRKNRECEKCPVGNGCPGTSAEYPDAPINPCDGLKTYQDQTEMPKCLDVYDCTDHEYEIVTPTRSRNRKCLDHKECGTEQWEVTAADYSSDRECADLATCGQGYHESVKPTATYVFRTRAVPGSLTNRECAQCGKGKFMPHSDHSNDTCEQCLPGTFEADEGSAECSPCIAGSVQPNKGQTTCTGCLDGKFQTNGGKTECEACDYNCEPGMIHKGCGKDAKGKCEQCDKGHFKECPFGMDKCPERSCQKCPAGTAEPNKGSDKCAPCASGTFQKLEGQKTCEKCNYQCPTGEEHVGCAGPNDGGCEPCAAGRAKLGENDKNEYHKCSDCAPGTYHETGGSVCKSCPDNTYQPAWKATGCLDCLKIAETCQPGQQHKGCGGEEPGTCPLCDAGTFKTNGGAGSCQPCDPGHFQGKEGQTSCKACPMDFYVTDSGAKECDECNYACPIGQEHTACGADDPGHCYNCPAGRAKNFVGGVKPNSEETEMRCKPCEPGEYQDEEGMATCKKVDGFNEYQPSPHAVYALPTRVCLGTEYETVAPTTTTNRECASHTTCTPNQYVSRAASTHFDRRCQPLTVCEALLEWETRAPGPDFDRQCKAATKCRDNEFESQPLTATSDRVCTPHTVCDETEEWQTKAAGKFHDRKCKKHTECTSTEWQTRQKGTHHDRTCSMLQECPNLECKEQGGMVFVHHHHTDHEVGFKYHKCSAKKEGGKYTCTCMCDSYPIKEGATPKKDKPTITFPAEGKTGNSVIWEASRTWEKHDHFTGRPGYWGAPNHAIDHAHHNKSDRNGKEHKIDPWLETSRYAVDTVTGKNSQGVLEATREFHDLKKCGAGYYCVNNQRTKVPLGYEAIGGDADTRSGIQECGDVEHYCIDGVKHAVSEGYYTAGGPETTRSEQRECGGNAYFCKDGRQHTAPCGLYTTGLNAQRRTGVAACNEENEHTHFCKDGVRRIVSEGHYSIDSCSQEKCGSDEFYCTAGVRHTVPEFATAIGGDHTGSTHTGCHRYNCPKGYEFVSTSCEAGGCVANLN